MKEEAEGDNDEDDKIKVSKDRRCHLIWEGIQKKKSFE